MLGAPSRGRIQDGCSGTGMLQALGGSTGMLWHQEHSRWMLQALEGSTGMLWHHGCSRMDAPDSGGLHQGPSVSRISRPQVVLVSGLLQAL